MGSLVAMSTETGRARRQNDDMPSVDRLLALSDGVVAIALTLLVLQLRVPSLPSASADSASALAAALAKGGDQLTAYVISFYVVAQFWLVHHRVFQHLVGQQEGLAWWNFGFLFTITIMPFTSDLLGQYGSNPLAVDIFALNLLLAALATQATSELGRRRGLMTPGFARRCPAGRTAAFGGNCNDPCRVHGSGLGEREVTRNLSGSCSPWYRISSTGGCAAIPGRRNRPRRLVRPAGRGRPARLRVSAGA